jgi:thymidylate synthase
MRQYLEVVKTILNEGQWKHTAHGVRSLSYPGLVMRFDLDEGFPLITTRNMKGSWRAMVGELLWLLSGSTNAYDLHPRGVRLWDSWATPEICAKFERQPGDLGPLYGHQWRNFGASRHFTSPNGSSREYWDDGVDQIKVMIELIKRNPDSRRIRVSSWNPRDVWKTPAEELQENVFITPCHGSFQIFHADGELTLILTQYSADVPAGVPFNTAEYALFLMMIANVTGKRAKRLVHFLSDAHIYEDQILNMQELITREPQPLPRVQILRQAEDIFSFLPEDFELSNYNPLPGMKIPVAV